MNHHTDTLHVYGKVKQPLVLIVTDFSSFESISLDSLRITNHRGEYKGTIYAIKGIRLRDVLERAVIEDRPREMGRYFIVCTSADGYETVFSWNEIFNNACGDELLIVTSVDGSSNLEDGILLINGCDIQNGRRHMKWLTRVEVRKTG